MINILKLNGLYLDANLGVTPDERIVKQKICINIEIKYDDIQPACRTDHIDDTICYDKICNLIYEYINSNEFRLIEYISYQLYQIIKNHINCKNHLKIEVIKCNPPIDFLKNGASYIYSDE